ncbi:Diguanylate cyclase [Azospirillaceae bacterium]
MLMTPGPVFDRHAFAVSDFGPNIPSIVSLLHSVRTHIRYAYQPIVHIHSGICYGFEALLRGHDRAGFSSIQDVFDCAYDIGCLHQVDLILRECAIRGFAPIAERAKARLFYNLDNRVLQSPDYQPHQTAEILERYGMTPSSLCFEISERHDLPNIDQTDVILNAYRNQSYLLALDDYGVGFSGLRVLYESHPSLVKIDRFFISDIGSSERKKLFVASIVNLARVLGVMVVAEGVETEHEFLTCKQIGCDLVQGYFVGRPSEDVTIARHVYDIVLDVNRRDRRRRDSDEKLVRLELEHCPALRINDSMPIVFEMFRKNKDRNFFPVIDEWDQPLGIVRENMLKDFIYSRYGRDLLNNRTLGRTLRDFLCPCPVCDISVNVEEILTFYSLTENPVGVIIIENFRYVGLLNASSLLRVINEKNLALARDQNPLTRLPGNNSINDYIVSSLEDRSVDQVFVWFDLDHFKPFNDMFGFRQGDRALMLFSEMMKGHLAGAEVFLGHIGGDDFFAGFRGGDSSVIVQKVSGLVNNYKRDCENFYDSETRERGMIRGKDRNGESKDFPLLSCSAGLVVVLKGEGIITSDALSDDISLVKSKAKQSRDHYYVTAIN